MNVANRLYLLETVDALRIELQAARSVGSAPVAIEAGTRLNADGAGGTYRFSLLFDSALPEGVPVELEVGGRRWEAEVLQRDGLSVLLLVRRDEQGGLPEPGVPFAQLHADPWYLLEALRNAVEELANHNALSTPAERLLDLLIGRTRPPSPPPNAEALLGLNPEQSKAVLYCAANDVWFVWGPPGTGKTTTLGRVVAAAAGRNESLLITAHSNVAVDAALVAAFRAGVGSTADGRVVRAGPAVLEEARATGLSTREIAFTQNPGLRRRLEDITKAFKDSAGAPLGPVIERWRAVMSELREAEESALRTADIVFTTVSKAVVTEAIHERTFDAAIVDEVSMTYPAQVLVAASLARRRINVFGDFRQLPPIVQSENQLAKERLGRDVFTACGVDKQGATGVTMLREQFRMHPTIRRLVSDFAYRGELRDAPNVGPSRDPMAALPPFEDKAVAWVDVAGLGAKRFQDRARMSRFNPVSALCSVALAIEARASFERVVVLTPYRTQARLLASLINDAGLDGVEVGTIHRYQGSEAPAVIVDLVEATGRAAGRPFQGTSGERLLTVGLSRAQGKLVVVGHGGMPTATMTRASARALESLQRSHFATLATPRIAERPNGFRVEFGIGVPSSVADRSVDSLTAAWMPDAVPPSLSHLDGAHVDRWSNGHVAWLGSDGAFGLHAAAVGRTATMLTGGTPRFVEALADAVTGAPLTRRSAARAGADEAPARATRHDQCAKCAGTAIPVDANRYYVDLGCLSCGASRRASDREIGAWLRSAGPACPGCRSQMKLRRGPRSAFLGCATYPRCNEMLELSALCDAAVHPDPPLLAERAAPSSRSRTSWSTTVDRSMCSGCFQSKPLSQFSDGGDLCVDCQ